MPSEEFEFPRLTPPPSASSTQKTDSMEMDVLLPGQSWADDDPSDISAKKRRTEDSSVTGSIASGASYLAAAKTVVVPKVKQTPAPHPVVTQPVSKTHANKIAMSRNIRAFAVLPAKIVP